MAHIERTYAHEMAIARAIADERSFSVVKLASNSLIYSHSWHNGRVEFHA